MDQKVEKKKNEVYGDFEEIVVDGAVQVSGEGEAPVRVRIPRKGELIGVIVQRFGGNRMEVLSTDGKKRNCRVPGRFKRALWLRPRDIVLITPWIDDNEKGDIIFKYNPSAVNQLRKRSMLNNISLEF